MSFTLPFTSFKEEMMLNYDSEQSISPEKQTALEKTQNFQRQKKELKGMVARQEERIRALRKSTGVEKECYEGKCRAQINYEKEHLLSEIDKKNSFIKELNARLREEEWMTKEETHWGEKWTNLVQLMRELTDLQAELKDSKRQLEVLVSIGIHQEEKAQAVRKELQQARDHVKWLLQCQVADELSFKGRVHQEEMYLQQLVEVRDTMQSEVHQLSRQEELEVLPLKEDVDTLETYLREMQGVTQSLESRCERLRLQVDEAQRMNANVDEESIDSQGEANCIERIDQDLVDILTEEIFAARKKNEIPISVDAQKDQWLQNYYAVWSRIQQQCEEILRNIRPNAETRSVESLRHVQFLQQRLDEVTGHHSGWALERRTALLGIENLLHFMHTRCHSESVMVHQIDEIATQLGVQAEPYVSLIKMEGYDDILYINNDEEVNLTESCGKIFDALSEESVEEAVKDITSAAEVAPNDDGSPERIGRPTRMTGGELQEFIQQKALFLNQMASQDHLPLQATNPQDFPPESVEDALSQVQERLIKEVLSFVKARSQMISQGQMDRLEESILPDPDYPREAQETQARIELLTELFSAPSVGSDECHAPFLQDPLLSHSFRRIRVDGARIPSDVLAASTSVQAKYFLSCAIRGFTTVMLTCESDVPRVQHLFLSRDMNRLCARDVEKLATESNSEDVCVKVEDIVDVVLTTDARLKGSKLEASLSFAIVVQTQGNSEVCWIVQTDNRESRIFWAYVFAWVANETSPKNEDAIVTHLKAEKKIFVLDSLGSMDEHIEPSERGTLHVQVSQE